MTTYTCPLCQNTMERDLVLFLDHTQQHIIDKIREAHPDWAEKDGTCRKCAEYYEKAKQGN